MLRTGARERGGEHFGTCHVTADVEDQQRRYIIFDYGSVSGLTDSIVPGIDNPRVHAQAGTHCVPHRILTMPKRIARHPDAAVPGAMA